MLIKLFPAGVGEFAHWYHTGGTQCSIPPTSQLIIAVSVGQPEQRRAKPVQTAAKLAALSVSF